jgi:hypothetical protein
MLPAVADGAFGVECRVDDADLGTLPASLVCLITATCINAGARASPRSTNLPHIEEKRVFVSTERQTLPQARLEW